MSRRARDEATARLKRGKSQDKILGNVSCVHVRSSVTYLSPDAFHGLTSFDRAPSLNRLPAQSSTETSGLGETVTSGFSSQESVRSCQIEDRDRVGFANTLWDRSHRKAGVTPGCIVRVPEFWDKGRGELSLKSHDSGRVCENVSDTVGSPQDTEVGVIRTVGNNSGVSENVTTTSSHHSESFQNTRGHCLTNQQTKRDLEKQRRGLEQNAVDRRITDVNETPQEQQQDRLPAPNSIGRPLRVECIYRHNKSANNPQLIRLQGRRVISSEADTVYTVGNSSGDSKLSSSSVHDNDNHNCGFSSVKSDRTCVVSDSPNDRVGYNSKGTLSTWQGVEVHKSERLARVGKEECFPADCHSYNNRIPLDLGSRGGESKVRFDKKDLIRSPVTTRCISDNSRESGNNFRKQPHEVSLKAEHISFNLINRRTEEPFIKFIDANSLSNAELSVQAQSSNLSGVLGSDVTFSKSQAVHGKSSKTSRTSRAVDRNKELELGSVPTPRAIKGERSGTQYVFEGVIRPLKGVNSIPFECADGVKDSYEHGRSRLTDIRYDNSAPKFTGSSIHPGRVEQGGYAGAKSGRCSDINYIKETKAAENYKPISILKVENSGPEHVHTTQAGPSSENTLNERSARSTRHREARRYDYKQESNVSSKSLSGSLERSHAKPCSVSTPDKRRGRDKVCDKGTVAAGYNRGVLLRVPEEISLFAIKGEKLRQKQTGNMDYDRLFQQAGRGLNGSGGGGGGGGDSRGNRGYQAVNDDDYSPTRQAGDGIFGYNVHGRNHVQQSRGSLGGTTTVSFANGRQSPVVQLSSVSNTAFHVPLPPLGPVPTVQLITSPDVPGLNLSHIDTEWERRGSKCSNRSHNSKSSGRASNRFLGVNTGSAWTRWSRERRASYRRRIEKLTQEEPVPTTTVVRISTPIKKARQEGLKFMHPDLEARYLSEDDLNELRRHKQQQVHAMRVIERNRRNKFRRATEVKLSAEQWHMLQEFWDHALFVRARYMGVLASLVALIFMLVSISSHSWVKHSEYSSLLFCFSPPPP